MGRSLYAPGRTSAATAPPAHQLKSMKSISQQGVAKLLKIESPGSEIAQQGVAQLAEEVFAKDNRRETLRLLVPEMFELLRNRTGKNFIQVSWILLLIFYTTLRFISSLHIKINIAL